VVPSQTPAHPAAIEERGHVYTQAARITLALPGSAAARSHESAFQELWLTLARRRWTSLVLVPADEGCSSAGAARDLVDVGKQLADGPVTTLTLRTLGYGSARALCSLPQFADRRHPDGAPPAVADDWSVVDVSDLYAETPSEPGPPRASTALAVAPTARLVISIPPVITEPLGLAVAQAADAVVVTFRLGRTRLSAARRTIELLGRDHIAGCVLEA
jgi:hypothetical protein